MDIRLELKKLTAATCTILLVFLCVIVPTDAHIFTTIESASFISLVDEIKSALTAISSDNSSSTAAIKEQTRYAKMLLNDSVVHELEERNERISSSLLSNLDSTQNVSTLELNANISMIFDILSEAISARIESDDLKNATIQAIVVAEDVDKISKQYETAFNDSADSTNSSAHMDADKPSSNVTAIGVKDESAYWRAAALTDIAIERFNSELKGNSVSALSTQGALDGLTQLKTSIESKVSPTDLLGIIRSQIHPNLEKAFGLQLANSTSNSTLMQIS